MENNEKKTRRYLPTQSMLAIRTGTGNAWTLIKRLAVKNAASLNFSQKQYFVQNNKKIMMFFVENWKKMWYN